MSGFVGIQVESYADLAIIDVWPDLDAPEIITEEAVLAVIDADTSKYRIATDWALPTELRVFLHPSCGCDAHPQRHIHRDADCG